MRPRLRQFHRVIVLPDPAGRAAGTDDPRAAESLVGRDARFLLVAGLVRWGGAPIEHQIRRYIDGIGWATLGALGIG